MTLINPQIDQKILKKNQRLKYLFRLNDQLQQESSDQHQTVINHFVNSAHIPAYMLIDDIRAVFESVSGHKHRVTFLTTLFFTLTGVSFGFTMFAQLTHQYTLAGSLAFLLSSVWLAFGLIVLDKLFIKQADVENLIRILVYFETVGEAND